jgi:predicted O-linked N-acetylglucosamine transferase (SPINDLY family)
MNADVKPMRPSAHHAELDAAVALHRAGALDEAERVYVALIERNPDDFDALRLRGTVRMQKGDLTAALEWLNASLRLHPDQPDALVNRGSTYLKLGDVHAALRDYDAALALVPTHLDGLLNRGRALREARRFEEALASHRLAIEANPLWIPAHNNAGVVLQDLRRFAEALACHDTALELGPNIAETHNYRGAALLGLDRVDEALASFERAIRLDPEYRDAHDNRAATLVRLGRYADALDAGQRALELDPNDATGWSNRGVALQETGAHEAALACLDRAVALRPTLADAHFNRGRSLGELGRWLEAADAYGRALAERPDFPYALGGWLHARMHVCDWTNFDEIAALVLRGVEAGQRACVPFPLIAMPSDAAQQLACARTFAADRYPPAPPVVRPPRGARARLRIGYLSCDFRDHPVAHLLLGLLEAHDRERFEIVAIACGPASEDATRARVRAAVDRFVDAGSAGDRVLAELVAAESLDILVDLMGYTRESRIGALRHRPAPIQVSWLGYTGTTGAPFVDYLVADAIVVPESHRAAYSEAIARLPDCYQVNPTREALPGVPSRESLGLPSTGVVFCCFNAAWKITPDVFAVWMGLLDAVPGSVLWLARASDAATANLRRTAAACGIDPARLVFAGRVASRAEHVARYRAADVFLDTFHYGAHTTAGDALSAGLPVVSLRGASFAGRVGASLLHAIGLPELVANTPADYAALAYVLATDEATRAAARAAVERGVTTQPLFRPKLFARRLESLYDAMWLRHAQGLPPADIDAAP